MDNIIKMVLAEASKSNVDKRKVGCVIVGPEGQILGVGHNSEYPPHAPLNPKRTPTTARVEHAEIMALGEVSSYILSSEELLNNSIVYVSQTPCQGVNLWG